MRTILGPGYRPPPLSDPRDAELLSKIREDPADDVSREVYADYLLEQGDARGELIALQFKEARGTATAADRKRVKKLLDEHWYGWTGPLAAALHRDESAFEKGFLSKATYPRVATPRKVLKAIVGDEHWATVHTIRSAHIDPSYPATLAHPVMRGLKNASLDGDELTRVAKGPVAWSLESLRLRSWRLEPAVLDALLGFEGLGELKELHLLTDHGQPVGALLGNLARRLRLFDLWLNTDPEPKALLDFLVSDASIAELRVGTRFVSCSARLAGGARPHLSIVLHHDSEYALAAATGLLRAAELAGFTSGTLTFDPDSGLFRVSRTPANKPTAAVKELRARASKIAGIPFG